jgi:hypothetical protein
MSKEALPVLWDAIKGETGTWIINDPIKATKPKGSKPAKPTKASSPKGEKVLKAKARRK